MIKITDRTILDIFAPQLLENKYRTALLFGGDPMTKEDWVAMFAGIGVPVPSAATITASMAGMGRPLLGYIQMPTFQCTLTDKKKFLIPCSQTNSLLLFRQEGLCSSMVLTSSSYATSYTTTNQDLYTTIVGNVGDVSSGEDFELGQREIIDNFEYRMNDITIKI